MIEALLLLVPAPDHAPLLEQRTILRRENAALRAQNAVLPELMRALGARPGQNSSNSSRPPSPCPTPPPASRPASSVKGEPKNTAIPGAVFVHSGSLGRAHPRAAGPCGRVRRAGAVLWRPPDRAVLYARRGVRRLRAVRG